MTNGIIMNIFEANKDSESKYKVLVRNRRYRGETYQLRPGKIAVTETESLVGGWNQDQETSRQNIEFAQSKQREQPKY